MTKRTDFATLQRPKSPNTYLVAPKALCAQAEPDRLSPVYGVSADKLFQTILRLIEARKQWTISTLENAEHYVAFVETSRVLKFKDDIDIQVMRAGDQQENSQLAIYSRSRVGYHDFGVNRKRVETLIGELNQYEGTTV